MSRKLAGFHKSLKKRKLRSILQCVIQMMSAERDEFI